MKILNFVFSCAFATLLPDAADATVTVFESHFSATAINGVDIPVTEFVVGLVHPTNPAPYQLDAIAGDTYSKNTLRWSRNGQQSIFSVDSQMNRDAARTGVHFYASDFRFYVDRSSDYEIGGYFNITDVGRNESGHVEQSATLYDEDSGVTLFSRSQVSRSTHNEQFVYGESGGDFYNYVYPFSSLTGTFLPGHIYNLSFGTFAETDTIGDSGASAVGNFTLNIWTVPEPASAALCAVFAILGLIRRK